MLDTEAIKASIPILEEKGVLVTLRMYDILVKDDRVKHFFSKHMTVEHHLPKALAATIISVAQNVDDLSSLEFELQRIAKLHSFFKLTPDHFRIVGEALTIALIDVVEPPARVIEAWRGAYNHLAEILINMESRLVED